MALTTVAAPGPKGAPGYNYVLRPGVAKLLNEAFAIAVSKPDPDDVDQVKSVYAAFSGRMQATAFRFDKSAAKLGVLEFHAYTQRTEPNTIFVRATHFGQTLSERARTLLHEYVHPRFPNNPGDGHPGGASLMFTRGVMGIAFDDAVRNPYCYEYYAKFVSTI